MGHGSSPSRSTAETLSSRIITRCAGPNNSGSFEPQLRSADSQDVTFEMTGARARVRAGESCGASWLRRAIFYRMNAPRGEVISTARTRILLAPGHFRREKPQRLLVTRGDSASS